VLCDSVRRAVGSSCWFAIGAQQVSKYRDSAAAANVVALHLVIVRLPHVGSDVLLSFNAPIFLSSESSVVKGANAAAAQPRHPADHGDVVYAALRTLAVHDWTLFGS
jgi:hypothetical protein